MIWSPEQFWAKMDSHLSLKFCCKHCRFLSYRLQACKKCKFVDLWEGCKIWPAWTTAYQTASTMIQKSGFFCCFLDVSWQNVNINNNHSHTILASNESLELKLSICVNFCGRNWSLSNCQYAKCRYAVHKALNTFVCTDQSIIRKTANFCALLSVVSFSLSRFSFCHSDLRIPIYTSVHIYIHSLTSNITKEFTSIYRDK